MVKLHLSPHSGSAPGNRERPVWALHNGFLHLEHHRGDLGAVDPVRLTTSDLANEQHWNSTDRGQWTSVLTKLASVRRLRVTGIGPQVALRIPRGST